MKEWGECGRESFVGTAVCRDDALSWMVESGGKESLKYAGKHVPQRAMVALTVALRERFTSSVMAPLFMVSLSFSSAWAQSSSVDGSHEVPGMASTLPAPGQPTGADGALPAAGNSQPSIGQQNSDIQIHPWRSVRVGFSASGAAAPGIQRDLIAPVGLVAQNYGVQIGARYIADAAIFGMRARADMAFSDSFHYLNLDLSLFRLRWPAHQARVAWVGVAPLEVEAQVSCVGDGCQRSPLRNRFGWRPSGLFGVIHRVGQNCVVQLMTRLGVSVGVQQTQGDIPVQALTGAEAALYCSQVYVDARYVHLFAFDGRPHPMEGTDVDRVEIDLAGRWSVGPLRLGPFLSGQVSYERSSPLAREALQVAPGADLSGAPRQAWDRLFFLGNVGIEGSF